MPNPHVNEKPTDSIAVATDKECQLLELSLSVFQTKEVLRDHVSSFGMARSWIIRNQDALKCYMSAYPKALEWQATVAEIEAERQTILKSVQKALTLAGKIAGDFPTEHGTQIIDELIAVEQIIDRMPYARLSDWRFLAEQRFGTEEALMAAVEKMERLVRAIGVVADGICRMTPIERLAAIPSDSRLSPLEIAELTGLKYENLRQRLNRWRNKHQGSINVDWYEVPDHKPRDAQYLYRVGGIRDIVADS